MRRLTSVLAALVGAAIALVEAQQGSGAGGNAAIGGELRQWHKVTLTLDGPESSETASDPNPFTDYRMNVTFTHESGSPSYVVPGYFAADGNAANTSATSGNKWRAHVAPDKAGRWNWRVSFVRGNQIAMSAEPGQPVAPFDGRNGTFQVAATDKRAPDFRGRGRLQYIGKHFLQFAGTGEYFVKLGADSPETLLAYADFDGTKALKPQVPLKSYAPHVQDWRPGDPTWANGKGKGLIGAINYLAAKGVNSISFIPYSAGGDGDNVWPFVDRDDKFHYDASKLDQWQVVFDHAQQRGVYLHFKLQENENDDNERGDPLRRNAASGRGAGEGGRGRGPEPAGPVKESLDGGDTGPERKLYLREMIARFGYNLALNWNLGEENTQTSEQQRAMADYIRATDPYKHHIVVHTFPTSLEAVYPPLLGSKSVLTGASLQTMWNAAHAAAVHWIRASDDAGKAWVVANDEQGPANLGVPPDPGYKGYADKTAQGTAVPYTLHDIRKYTLWANLMAGGAGVEYYFGYQLAENDLVAEDFRSRDKSWDYGRLALELLRSERVPLVEMKNVDELVGNAAHDNGKWALAKPGDLYLAYLPTGGTADLDLAGASGQFTVNWFDPRNGGALQRGSVSSVRGGASASLGLPPREPGEDWLVVVRRAK